MYKRYVIPYRYASIVDTVYNMNVPVRRSAGKGENHVVVRNWGDDVNITFIFKLSSRMFSVVLD
jgi:hypothetical protein